MKAHVLVIDIGKTHARAITFDPAGSIVRREQVILAPLPALSYRRLPVPAMLAFIGSTMAEAASRCEALSVIPVTHGAAAALIDADGLVLPVLDYEDDAPEAAVDYDDLRPPFAETFSPNLPLGLNLGRQLAWLEQAFPTEVARATHFLTLPQFIGWRLTGRAVAEVTSLGCHTDLWAPLSKRFSSLVEARGWRERFPPVLAAGAVLGPLRSDLASRLGIGTPVTILNGLHDSNAALVPHLQGAERFTMVSSGTWIICMAVGGGFNPALPAARDCLANVDVRGSAYPCARFMGGREFALLAGGRAQTTLDALPLLRRIVADGRMILPSHAPGGGPFPEVTGTFPPILADERAAMATLYLALMTDACCGLIGSAGQILIEGPAAANPLFAAVLQALHPDRPVTSSTDTDATARGAASLALGTAATMPSAPAERVEIAGLDTYAAAWRAAAEARLRV